MNDVTITVGRLTDLTVGVRRSQLLLAIGVGLVCSAGLLLTAGTPLKQAMTVDPFINAGYIHDYAGLLWRFGPTYYSERIAYIYPARAFTYFVGLQGGYFAFRFVALASAVAGVFTIGMRFYGWAAAMLAAVWVSFTPWLPRGLSWTYPDGMAVVYLLVGMAFLLVPIHRRLTCHVAAGVAFALAVNCNLLMLAICGLLGPGWAFFYRRDGIIWLARAMLALAVGFFAAYLALALLLYVEFPEYGFSFELVTIRTAIKLLGGAGEVWYEPLSSIIWQRHQFVLLIPITFELAALLVVARRSTIVRTANSSADFEVLAVSYLASVICLSLIFHFAFHDAWLAEPEYIIYFMPGSVLTLIVLAGAAHRRGGRIFGNVAVLSGTGLILLSWLSLPIVPSLQIASSPYFWLGVAVAVVGAAMALHRTAAASVVLVAAGAVLSLCLYRSSNGFYDIRSEDKLAQWDGYRGAIFLQDFVNDKLSPNQRIGFWYNDDNYLRSIQSTFLFDYTRVFDEGRGMPLVDERFRREFVGRPFIVLLGSDAETNSGLAALKVADLPFHEVDRAHFQGQLWAYTAVLIETKPAVTTPGFLLFNVPLARLELDPMAVSDGRISISPLGDALRVTTAARQWTNSLRVRLRPLLQSVQREIVLRVRLKVEEGAVGIYASTSGEAIPITVARRREVQEVYLKIPDASATEWLFVRNESPAGPSRAVVYSVDVLRPDGS